MPGAGLIEQKVAENEVDKFRRALGPFVVAAEATRMPMAFTNATAAGNPLIFANDSFLALTGYKGAEVVGQSFDFLMSAMADPDAIDRIAAQFEMEKWLRSQGRMRARPDSQSDIRCSIDKTMFLIQSTSRLHDWRRIACLTDKALCPIMHKAARIWCARCARWSERAMC